MAIMNLLFVYSKNRLRSPTAEALFSGCDGIVAIGAGVNPDSPTPLSGDQIEWADIVFVMEESQRQRIARRFAPLLHGKRVVVLGIPDNYEFMDPMLIKLLKEKVEKHLR